MDKKRHSVERGYAWMDSTWGIFWGKVRVRVRIRVRIRVRVRVRIRVRVRVRY